MFLHCGKCFLVVLDNTLLLRLPNLWHDYIFNLLSIDIELESKVMSQDDLAKASGVAASTICKIEQGKQKARFVTLRKLAAALKVDPTEIDR